MLAKHHNTDAGFDISMGGGAVCVPLTRKRSYLVKLGDRQQQLTDRSPRCLKMFPWELILRGLATAHKWLGHSGSGLVPKASTTYKVERGIVRHRKRKLQNLPYNKLEYSQEKNSLGVRVTGKKMEPENNSIYVVVKTVYSFHYSR